MCRWTIRGNRTDQYALAIFEIQVIHECGRDFAGDYAEKSGFFFSLGVQFGLKFHEFETGDGLVVFLGCWWRCRVVCWSFQGKCFSSKNSGKSCGDQC